MVSEGDTVLVYHTAHIGEVIETGVDGDMDRPDDCKRMARTPEADTLVRERWSREQRTQYADGPGRYVLLNERLLQSP